MESGRFIGNSELRRLFISGTKVFALLGSLWLVFYSVYTLLPYLKTGYVIIYTAKVNTLCCSIVFPKDVKYKIVIFGNSKVLAGFKPDSFDSTDAESCSYNLGLPDADQFLPVLELLIQRNQVPTHVFLTVGWPEEGRDNARFALPSDRSIMKTLFPFRKLPRDLMLFLMRSQSHGGIAKYYQYKKESEKRMLSDRGYYFIEGQSYFPNHRLPEGFKWQGDTPDQIYRRTFDMRSSTFQKLIELHEKHNINFYIVPTYFRSGSYAQPPVKNHNADIFAEYPGLYVLGTEYYLFPGKYFSDPAHVNPEGAELYTQKLRQLFEKNIINKISCSSSLQ